MRRRTKAAVVAVFAGALALGASVTGSTMASAADTPNRLDVVGLSGGTSLVEFDTRSTRISDTYRIAGLAGDTRLVGIDYRVQDGELYGVGEKGGLYRLDEYAKATKVGQLSVALSGTNFGVDFNPAANALRVVSDAGQNLRQPFANLEAGTPLAATVTDTPLTNPATPPATGTVPAAGVTGSAYTNNDLAATTSVTLFALDTTADRISLQSPANAGTLAPTGSLGVNAAADAGFDIYSALDDDVTVEVSAYASLQVGGKRSLYLVDLLTGQLEDNRGSLPTAVTDIALPLDQ